MLVFNYNSQMQTLTVNGMILNRNTSFKNDIKGEIQSVSLVICKQVLFLVRIFFFLNCCRVVVQWEYYFTVNLPIARCINDSYLWLKYKGYQCVRI